MAAKPATGVPAGVSYHEITVSSIDYRGIHRAIGELLDKQIFFVGGAIKSGTTWFQKLLDLHPEISCGGESHFITSLYPKLKQALEEHNQVVLNRKGNTAYELGKAPPLFSPREFLYALTSAILLLLLQQTRGKEIRAVGEKTTINVQVFSALGALFPGAKCLQIVRDPRDGVISGWHHVSRLFPEDRPARFPSLRQYLEEYAAVWSLEVGSGVAFGERFPEQYLDLRYEDLVAEPEPTLARVFRFLGVDDSPSVVRQCIDGGSFERLSGGRARGQEDPNSFFRKGMVGDWKGRLTPDLLAHIIEKDGPLMRRYGYLASGPDGR